MKRRLLLSVLLVVMTSGFARAEDYADHRSQPLGLELDILWPFPPFRTYEVKFRGKLGHGVEGVVGYGLQRWSYQGTRHNPGTMNSSALLLGARSYVLGTNASVEYTAWLCHDVFHHANGQTYRGFSLDNEFYAGYSYYLPGSNLYLLPQWNAAFWSYKSYEMPINDLYVFDFLPKVSLGADF